MIRIPKRSQGQTRSHDRSKVQERETAERIGGRVTKASGASYEKADVRLKGFVRIESKCTKNASYSVSEATIEKLEAACFGAGEVPILHVELGLGRTKFVVLPDYALDLILEALKSAD